MKRLIVSLCLVIGMAVFVAGIFPARSAAADVLSGACQGDGKNASVCQDRTTKNPLVGKNGLLSKAASIIAFVAGMVAVFVFLIGSVLYVMSGGDSGRLNTGREMIIYSLVGIVIIASAGSITVFIINRL